MIVAVEGITAAGKTTWCREHAPAATVAQPAPAGPDATARFWVEVHARRWAEALALERSGKTAYCDTDPLKLHYPWSLWKLGEISRDQWRAAYDEHRRALERKELGFVDAVLLLDPGEAVARARREADPERRRRRFELHVRLAPYLRAWYDALDSLSTGRVTSHLDPSTLPELRPRDDRCDPRILESLVSILD